MAQTQYPSDRWAWVEIDLGAIKRNTRAFRSMIDPGTKLMCVVKANAYGHGAVACAKAMRSGGADQFAVATVAEGVELRKAGATRPILILNQPPIDAVPTLVEYDIMPSVYGTEFVLAYGECAAAA
ncbi:alanine racemase, partial [uncultured Olegusella sp.]|uniref:alanine racemase n=1 Tax=uncultured Olegusella sp. TaxID=1979846 RepID=UPI0026022165